MAYVRRTAIPSAKLRPVSPTLSTDQRLEHLTSEILKRMEAELDRYSVPQLLSGLHKCLQVRVLLLTLKLKGGGDDVGSSVRKYAGSFSTANASGGRARGARSTRRAGDDAFDDNVAYLTADPDDE